MTVLLALLFCFPQMAFALTGREIMDRSDKLASPSTAKTDMAMLIYKGKIVDKKTFTAYSKEYSRDETKILISFHKPTRIQLLTHNHKGQEDDQWITLSSGRVKRVVSSDKGKPFVHSNFYYEDLGSLNIDDYEYKYIGDAKAVGADCYKVESIKKKNKEKVYDKKVVYVLKSDYFVVRIDFYQHGQLHKYLENRNIKNKEGILTPYHIVMFLAGRQDRTELKVGAVEYNMAIPDSKFNKETLR
jgi:hypothetical protein